MSYYVLLRFYLYNFSFFYVEFSNCSFTVRAVCFMHLLRIIKLYCICLYLIHLQALYEVRFFFFWLRAPQDAAMLAHPLSVKNK